MEKLPKEQQESIKKLNTDRIRARLSKLGVDEEVVCAAGRDELLAMLAELTLNPIAPPEPTPAEAKEIRMREIELREKELNTLMEMHRQQLEAERQQREVQRQRYEAEQLAQRKQYEAEQLAQRNSMRQN